jgi:cell filamentation protein, protein adenylyltransferase
VAGRYDAVGPEAEFQPGSRGRVFRNRLGIISVRELERTESAALLIASQEIIDETRVDQRFTAGEICRMHQLWLGEIYEWAGEYRGLNIAKGAFMFAAAIQIPRLMQDLERGPLREYTPCSFNTTAAQATALAIVHTELILIHPFRDGNGRCARLLAMLMGLQAGLPALDFGGIRGAKKREYIAAVHAGLSRDYDPMTKIFREVIVRTLKSVAKPSSV